jgi:hypothetical protein
MEMPFALNPRILKVTGPHGSARRSTQMADKSPKKDATKKVADKSLKEKRADKKAKSEETASRARKS